MREMRSRLLLHATKRICGSRALQELSKDRTRTEKRPVSRTLNPKPYSLTPYA